MILSLILIFVGQFIYFFGGVEALLYLFALADIYYMVYDQVQN